VTGFSINEHCKSGGVSAKTLWANTRGIDPLQDFGFERDGADLHTLVALSFPQAALGAVLKASSLDGDIDVAVPAGTQPGDTLNLRGKGLPRLQGRGNGDLVVHLKLVVPKSL